MAKSVKLIILDLDNTIAESNRPVSYRAVRWMKWVEKRGVRIALASGKPIAYLAGLARQIGLKGPILAGENGALIHYTANFPPEKIVRPSAVVSDAMDTTRSLRSKVVSRFGDRIWVQPNEYNLTLFFDTQDTLKELRDFFAVELSKDGAGKMQVYCHVDSIELIPASVNKGVALREIMRMEKLVPTQVIAVGDGENDIPMFREAGSSIGIRMDGGTHRFESISRAMTFLTGVLESGSRGG